MTPRVFFCIAALLLATCVLNVAGWYKLHDKYGQPGRNYALVPAARMANTNAYFKQIRAAYNGELLFTADDYLTAGIRKFSLPRGTVESNPFPRNLFCAPPVAFMTDKNGDLWASHYQNSIWYDSCAATSQYGGSYYLWSPGYVYKYQAISRYNSAGALQQNYNMPIDVAWHLLQFTLDRNEDLYFIRGGNFPFVYSGFPCMLRISSDYSYFCYAEQNGNWRSIGANIDPVHGYYAAHDGEGRYWRQDLGQQYGQYTSYVNESQAANIISSSIYDNLIAVNGLSVGGISWNTGGFNGQQNVYEMMFSNLPDSGNTLVSKDRSENVYVANGINVYRIQQTPEIQLAPRGSVTAFTNAKALLYDSGTVYAGDVIYGIRRLSLATNVTTTNTWSDSSDTPPISIGSITRDNRNASLTRFVGTTGATPYFTASDGQAFSLSSAIATVFDQNGVKLQQFRNPSPYLKGIPQSGMTPTGELMMLMNYDMAGYAWGLARLNLATGQTTGFLGWFSDITQIVNYDSASQDSPAPGTPFYYGMSSNQNGATTNLYNILGFAYDRVGTLYVSNGNEIYSVDTIATPTNWQYDTRILKPATKPATIGYVTKVVSKLWESPTRLAFDLHDNLIVLEAAGALWSLNPQGLRSLLLPVQSTVTRAFAVNPSLTNALIYTTGTSKQLQTLSLPGLTVRGKFDSERYLLHQNDVRTAGQDPWSHWYNYGYYEQRTIYLQSRDGTPGGYGVFDGVAYLAAYDAQITDPWYRANPLHHYRMVGFGLNYDAFVTTSTTAATLTGWSVPTPAGSSYQNQNVY